MNVLSLFDGISCARVALEQSDVKIGKTWILPNELVVKKSLTRGRITKDNNDLIQRFYTSRQLIRAAFLQEETSK